MKYYIRNGKVGVLISPGYGAGYSTWNDEELEVELDARIIEMVLAGKTPEELIEKQEEIYGEDFYLNGSLAVVFIPCGEYYYIKEYDGNEQVITIDERRRAPMEEHDYTSRKPDCHDQDDAEFGGECSFSTCKHHSKDEPICQAERV